MVVFRQMVCPQRARIALTIRAIRAMRQGNIKSGQCPLPVIRPCGCGSGAACGRGRAQRKVASKILPRATRDVQFSDRIGCGLWRGGGKRSALSVLPDTRLGNSNPFSIKIVPWDSRLFIPSMDSKFSAFSVLAMIFAQGQSKR